MVKINSKLINIRDFLNVFYPVGSYYETSDTSFNPNTTWGGTWVEDTAGRTTVAYDSTQTEFDSVGETGGEKTHKLIAAEIPSLTYNFTTSRPVATQGGYPDGQYFGYGSSEDVASRSYTNKITTNAGGGSHNNLQPYIVVKRWHRTA